MDIREKLVELLKVPIYPHLDADPADVVADYLLDNDVVPVVRCKDCKNYHAETGWCNEHSSFIDDRGVKCHPWESSDWRMFNENDFCNYGERRAEQ